MGYYLNYDKTKYCNLTVNDYELLQTLPLDYVDKIDISESSKYKAIGNGWTVEVIAHILKGIR
ncbi:MAG: DNA cytosine methyltransferase [Lachnospiraceae bacterium]|nr:DNA cytosine methyltransferase [Lachnospiraceae bacterium]